jgi:hypothetical protein
MENDTHKLAVKLLIGPSGFIQFNAFVDLLSTNVKRHGVKIHIKLHNHEWMKLVKEGIDNTCKTNLQYFDPIVKRVGCPLVLVHW